MIRPTPPKPTGIAGLLFLFCAVGVIAGVGFDFASDDIATFGLVSEPGARAVIGVAVAVGVVLIAHALRFVLGSNPKSDREGGDAGDRA
jgi:hypothetical protein